MLNYYEVDLLGGKDEKMNKKFFSKKHSMIFSYSNIHWEAFSHAFKAKSATERVMITKFIHGWLLTGYRRALISNRSTSCPHFKEFEATEHILTCNNSKMKYNSGL